MDETIWVMDSEYCGNCGTYLSPYESVLCTDCLHDAWYDEERDYYVGWDLYYDE